ncbi:hypothetical protein [Microbacterium aurum]|uniref:hypothetical protein n=1 Tax=Microbacterium aurum TaxID=36805 RepID=UPI0028EC7CC9|nr:hypothetical protein [Microbacterium aurum]
MDEVVRLTRTYVVVVWLFALLVGALAGAGLGFLLKEPWTGVIVGIGVAALVGSSAILGARRSGRGTFEGAPPSAGVSGARQDVGGPGGF